MPTESPTLHILCGKIASGKSTLAAQLSAKPGTVHPNTKKRLFFSCRGVEKKCNYRLYPVVTMINPRRFRTSWCKVFFLNRIFKIR